MTDELELWADREASDETLPAANLEAKEMSDEAKEPDAVEPVFEEALKELESIVAQMESGQLKLDECVAQFEKGAKLAGWCT